MLNRLGQLSTNYLIKRKVVLEKDREIYEYGFHSLYNNIIDIGSIAIISIWLRQVPETLIYHFSFVLLRNTAGGFHAKTHLQCFTISTVIWLASLYGISHPSPKLVYIAIAIFVFLLVWKTAPIEHENSPLSNEKYIRMKKVSRCVSTIFLVLVIVLSIKLDYKYVWVYSSLVYGMISYSILALPIIGKKLIDKQKTQDI